MSANLGNVSILVSVLRKIQMLAGIPRPAQEGELYWLHGSVQESNSENQQNPKYVATGIGKQNKVSKQSIFQAQVLTVETGWRDQMHNSVINAERNLHAIFDWNSSSKDANM